jgi:zinc protease
MPQGKSILTTAERYTLGNGMKVVLLPTDSPLPLVRARVIFGGGSSAEPVSKAGLAAMAARYLVPELDADFMKTGVWIQGDARDDVTVFAAGGLNMYSDVIVTALERALKIGTYDQERLEDAQKSMRQQLESKSHREAEAFNREHYAALFGADHPYTVKGTATQASIGALGYDAATAFKRDHYTAKNATLVIAGAFDPVKVKAQISDTFGDWSSGGVTPPVGPAQAPRTGPIYKGVLVAKEGPQMQVRIAYPAPAGEDDLAAARMVMAEMLNDRLFRIRTELGSTYGTYANRTTNLGPNAYMMGGGVDKARAGESLKAMREKVESLRRGDDFDADFVAARRAVLKNLISVSSEPSALVARLGQIAAFGLTADHYDKLTRQVATMSPAQVRALIAAELKPENEVVVCMAGRETLEKAFAEAGIAKVELVDPK